MNIRAVKTEGIFHGTVIDYTKLRWITGRVWHQVFYKQFYQDRVI